MKKNERMWGLDFLKLAAAVLIVFHHYQQVRAVLFPSGINFWSGGFYFGYLVELFFMISGFVTALSVEKVISMPFDEYMRKKLIRIYPMVFISTFVYCIAAWIYRAVSGIWYQDLVIGIWKTFASMLLIGQSGGVVNNFGLAANNPTWYLTVLIICYVIYWFVVHIAEKYKFSKHSFYLLIVFVVLGINSYGMNLILINSQSSRGIMCFFLGAVLPYYSGIFKRMSVKCGLIITNVVLVVLCYKNYMEMADSIYYILIFMIYPSIVGLMAYTDLFSSAKIADSKVCRIFKDVLGGISFEMYLWHVPLMMILSTVYMVCGMTITYSRKTMVIFLVFDMVVAGFVYVFLEKPITKYLKSRLDRKIEVL